MAKTAKTATPAAGKCSVLAAGKRSAPPAAGKRSAKSVAVRASTASAAAPQPAKTRCQPKKAARVPAGHPKLALDLSDDSLPGLPALSLKATGSFAAGEVFAVPVHLVDVAPFISVRVVDEAAVFTARYAEYGTADVSVAAIAAICGAAAPRRVLACPRLTTSAIISFGGGINQKVLRGVPNAKTVLSYWKSHMSSGAGGGE